MNIYCQLSCQLPYFQIFIADILHSLRWISLSSIQHPLSSIQYPVSLSLIMIKHRFGGPNHTGMVSQLCLKDSYGMICGPQRHSVHFTNGGL